ncbi:MAG: hypothetical protein Q9191_007669, partial [Dirinaria sp. TL-2023a]
ALVLAKQNDRVYASIRLSTRAIVFFGTPHRGGNGTTFGQTAANVVKFFTGNRSNDLIDTLKSSSKYLAHLTADFAHQYEDYEFLSIVETKGILRAPLRTVVVDSSSSVIGLAGHRERLLELDRDHRQICKYANIDDDDCKRIITQIKRLADNALMPHQDSIDQSAKSHELAFESPQAEERTERNALMKYNTVDFCQKEKTIGQSHTIQSLEHFVLKSDSFVLLLYGPAGSGKTQIAHEFATCMLGSHSVFWLSGQSTDAVQSWIKHACCKIHPDFYSSDLRSDYASLREWLMNEGNGKWLLIVDDLRCEDELQKLLPNPIPWGKLLVTSRQESLRFKSPMEKLLLPPLTTEEGTSLFWSRSHPMISSTALAESLPELPMIRDLCDIPAALVFAASCTMSTTPSSIPSYLSVLEEESGLIGPVVDSKPLKWAFIAIKDLDPAELTIIKQIFMFCSWKISKEALEVILAPSRLRSSRSDSHVIPRQVLQRCLDRLVNRRLLQRQRDPWCQYYSMPTIIGDALHRNLASDQAQFQIAAETARSLLRKAFQAKKFNDVTDLETFMSIIEPHYRAIPSHSTAWPEHFNAEPGGLPEGMALYYIVKAIDEGVGRSTKQFWRKWMLQNGYELSQQTARMTEDEQNEPLDVDPTTPIRSLGLADANIDMNDTLDSLRISSSIKDTLWKALRDSITVGMIGSGWHGIREDIFDYIRQNSNSRSDVEVAAIIDFIDKGACDGLINAIKSYVHGDVFKEEMMGNSGADVVYDLAELVYRITDERDLIPDITIVSAAVEKALGFLMHSTFLAVSRAFDGMLHPLKSTLKTMLEGPLKGSSPDSFEKFTSFIISYMSAPNVKSHALSAGRAFWDVISTSQIWLAAAIVSRMSFAAMTSEAPILSQDFDDDDDDEFTEKSRFKNQKVAALNHCCVELLREGIIEARVRSTPAWRLSMRKATYWCLLAEEQGQDWLDDDSVGCEYRNQDRWEEACIDLDMLEPTWPLY